MSSRTGRGPDVDQGHEERRWLQDRDALTCGVGWWACQDLNLGPHPYQVSRAKRCAQRRFPRSPRSVRGKGMRSNNVVRTGAQGSAMGAARYVEEPVAGKAMGLPGGRGSAIGRVILAW